MYIRQAALADVQTAAEIALLLWPNHTLEELAEEMAGLLCDKDSAIFLAEEENRAVAFSHCSIRHDYVQGARTSPVGYLEGIYVRQGWRRRGIAGTLVRRCESWAGQRGCREMASDCELSNEESLAFHLGIGFSEANRTISFVKPLQP